MDPRAQYAYNFYLQKGYSPTAAAGIVGNLHAESGFSTNASGDQGSASGLAQWRGSRLDGLHKYASDNGMDPRSMDAQLGYVDYEMRNGTDAGAAKAYQGLQNAQTPAQAAQTFMQNYERPNADPSINHVADRQSFANNIAGIDTSNIPAIAQVQDPSGGITSLATAGTAATQNGIAALAPGAVAGLPTVQEAADPMAGIFSLLTSAQQTAAPPPTPAPMQRPNETQQMTPDQKMAMTSQTPNVYLDRMKRNSNA